MNHMQPYQDVHQNHISAAPTHAASSGPPTGMTHYPPYQQPSVLQSAPPNYSSAPSTYSQYAYGGGMPPVSAAHAVSSSMSNALVPGALPLPAMTAGAPGAGSLSGSQNYPHTFDTTGQVAPPGMKPRVTATLWEDEGSLCFQVEAKGVCVARREDNHMINGTKLLNVAGMTRGRRDGILKSEKTRHVVKIGPMHLKGVWIPFDRALDFANKEKITEQLYPLFVHDIGALLYHPSNSQTRAGIGGMAAVADRRRQDQRYIGTTQPPQPPSLHHHHSMSNPVGTHMNQQQPHSIAPHPSAGRPGLDRAHTFPTPPTSASSIIGMGNQGSSYEWNGAAVSNLQSNQPLSIDTGLSNARSVPTTPATTPPGAMQNMQYQTSQAYDSQRQMYTAPPTQQQPSQYGSQTNNMVRYGQPLQPSPYQKNEMAPPARTAEGDQQSEVKPHDPLMNQQPEQPGHAQDENEADHEHEPDYTHSAAPYTANRSYTYPNATATSLHAEHPHLSPEMTGSPHQNGSGRATPRTTVTAGGQWSTGYSTPQRGQQPPSSNLYSVMSDNRGATTNGNAAPDSYSAPPVQSAYPSQAYPTPNGLPPSNKRVRELDDDEDPYGRSGGRGPAGEDIEGLKRRKTIREGSVGGAVGVNSFNNDQSLQRAKSTISQRRR
ncbi:cell pattern formation-associated protein stuA [Patellaria atrata CBS 101060]|uniref:Cell pattern formation-associated protein stuA n=1 Tax=Patellaria atrata CBS 101060 TaxID=1346257 RepID=A0A9P4VLJ5_9PEZI|nr:cell pattern formation-associated protein stuA [Patellaria atrata CBS 101060]